MATPRESIAVPPYLLSDDPGSAAVLDEPRQLGVVVAGRRVVLSNGVPTQVAKEENARQIVGWRAMPKRWGKGFLFHSRWALFRSDTFVGPLTPVAQFSDIITDVTVGPRALIVSTDGGSRFGIDPVSGAEVAVEPRGLVMTAANGDGDGLALVELGRLLATTDAGTTWSEAMPALAGRTLDIVAGGDGRPCVLSDKGDAACLSHDGRLEVLASPPKAAAPRVRPPSPAWREDEPPLRRALRVGAPTGDGSAIVASRGDVVRVSLATGDVEVLAAGKLPREAECEAARVDTSFVFLCVPGAGGANGANGASLAASFSLATHDVQIEQAFAAPGRFYGGDDGGLAFGGPCASSSASASTVCARGPDGVWHEHDFAAGDAGARVHAARWVPRRDGTAVGVLVPEVYQNGDAVGLADTATMKVLELAPSTTDPGYPVFANAPCPWCTAEQRAGSSVQLTPSVVDRSWTTTAAGTLRAWRFGWLKGPLEIALADGATTKPLTDMSRLYVAGPMGLAEDSGTIKQTMDRGAHWSAVAAPAGDLPLGQELVPAWCGAAGCDLGSWYRMGWEATDVGVPGSRSQVSELPAVDRPPVPSLVCARVGDETRAVLPPTTNSPDDFGLGAQRIALDDAARGISFARKGVARTIPSLMARPEAGAQSRTIFGIDVDMDEREAALEDRAFLYGFDVGYDYKATKASVLGPDPNIGALRRSLSFVPSFDPRAPIRRVTLAVSDVVAAAKAAGAPVPNAPGVIAVDPADLVDAVPILPRDASAPSDLFFSNEAVYGSVRTDGRMRFFFPPAGAKGVISAVALDADSVAVLEQSRGGGEIVRRLSAASVTTIFALPDPPAAQRTAMERGNLDALAISTRGDLGLLRMPGGKQRPSAFDPAMFLVPGAPAVFLAPWSTATEADDPACAADVDGVRAIVEAGALWLQPAVTDVESRRLFVPSLLRVKWSPARVCVEAVEVASIDDLGSMTPLTAAVPKPDGPPRVDELAGIVADSWIVARFAGQRAAGMAAVARGSEVRQALDCRIGPAVP